MARKKTEGIDELLRAKTDPVSIQEITMLDWFAAFALIGASPMTKPEDAAKEAFDRAEACLKERAIRI
jgi:hypothetical protein